MIQLITALPCEAQPLINHFRLKKQTASTFKVYQNDTITLIVSGIGKLRSAIATTYLLTTIDDLSSTFLFNIGICGSSKKDPIGTPFLIHKIVDHSTQKNYFLDIPPHDDFKRAVLETFDQPVLNTNQTTSHLVDMEAFGYYTAAMIFLPKRHVQCLKIVSDHLEDGHFDKFFISDLIQQNITIIETLIENTIHKSKEL